MDTLHQGLRSWIALPSFGSSCLHPLSVENANLSFPHAVLQEPSMFNLSPWMLSAICDHVDEYIWMADGLAVVLVVGRNDMVEGVLLEWIAGGPWVMHPGGTYGDSKRHIGRSARKPQPACKRSGYHGTAQRPGNLRDEKHPSSPSTARRSHAKQDEATVVNLPQQIEPHSLLCSHHRISCVKAPSHTLRHTALFSATTNRNQVCPPLAQTDNALTLGICV
jgi:hypothetical protein